MPYDYFQRGKGLNYIILAHERWGADLNQKLDCTDEFLNGPYSATWDEHRHCEDWPAI